MRLIDADSLRKAFYKDKLSMCSHVFAFVNPMDEDDLMIEINAEIDNVPTIDAVPVVHGEWKCTDDFYESGLCSVCKWESDETYICSKQKYHYCPNCGAKMDGETEYVSTYSLGKIAVPKGAIKQIIADGKEQTE